MMMKKACRLGNPRSASALKTGLMPKNSFGPNVSRFSHSKPISQMRNPHLTTPVVSNRSKITFSPKRFFSAQTLLSAQMDRFGERSFDMKKAQAGMSSKGFAQFSKALEAGQAPPEAAVEEYASAIHKWATSNFGVTHFTHRFQPLRYPTAEKHDSFLTKTKGEFISKFSAKSLVKGEPDGSSFPSAGLRDTSTARGYTLWDPTSAPFIDYSGGEPTLTLNSIFISWNGDALDLKTPLLRSYAALKREGLRFLDSIGETDHKVIRADSGLEQEFFMFPQEMNDRRPDLLNVGRTLQGALPATTQELADQYFTYIDERMMKAIKELERESWALGIPLTTRHTEVAPNQFEVAPYFSEAVTANDQNLTLMNLAGNLGKKHGITFNFHEKPFAHVNGSGKHNNWSVGSDKVGTFFNPSERLFPLFTIALLAGLDRHPELVRWAVSGIRNDLRLGGHEAPPAIISAYLGEEVQNVLDNFVSGKENNTTEKSWTHGVDVIPTFAKRDPNDRNRTSPFAYTGGKFELRATGSSQNPADTNLVLNTILADALRDMTAEIQKLGGGFQNAQKVAARMYNQHKRIIFGGDGYSEDWVKEAASRGLPNYRTTPDVLNVMLSEKNFKLFKDLGIYTPSELESRVNVAFEHYNQTARIEAETTLDLVNRYVYPAATNTILKQSSAVTSVSLNGVPTEAQKSRLVSFGKDIEQMLQSANTLSQAVEAQAQLPDDKASHHAKETTRPAMDKLREAADKIEKNVDARDWALPTYHDMLVKGRKF